jgi:hypothetical protein
VRRRKAPPDTLSALPLRSAAPAAVNSSAVFLALLSFQLWRFSVKELLATYIGKPGIIVSGAAPAGGAGLDRFRMGRVG